MGDKRAAQTPFTTHLVTSTDGTTIGYRRYGRGRPSVVLVHGGMMAAQGLNDLAGALSTHFTLCVPDLRGRGMSGAFGEDHSITTEVEDLHAVVVETGAGSVFGLSAGAVFALEAARRLPEIEQLAVYEPPFPLTGEESTVGWLPEYEKMLDAGNLGGALITVSRGTGDSSALRWLPRFLAEPFMNFAIRAQAAEVGEHEVPLKDLIPTLRHDARIIERAKDELEVFRGLQARILLMRGTRSPRNLQAPIDALRVILPHAEYCVLQGAGHLAPTNGQQTRTVAQRLKAFFTDEM